ncbi:MAG: hypothetical protein HY900_21425 [Deltaproteobacteria bacterium]|nr:hypothetical protein [Deltaproteobacteria bacterium]
MRASSAAPALLFLAVRSARNSLLQRLRRLREARYLVGFLIAIGYFSFMLRGPMARIRGGRPAGADALPAEALAIVLLGASALLLGLLALFWVFRRGSAALSLSESEAHFLFAAPLTRSAIVHYALLRPQLGVLFGSFILTVMSGRIARPGGWRTLVGSWLALATVGFHLRAMGFFKARLRSRGLVLRITAFLVILGAAASAVTATALWLLDLRTVLPALPDGGSLLSRGALLWEELLPWRSRFVPSVLLVPFRLFLAPLFAPTATAFLAALPGAAVLLLLNYAWLMRTSVAYEEATLAAADAKARRNALRVAMREGIALPAEGQRTAVPFDLAPAGRPELAVTWKNLLVHGRTRLATLGRAAAIMALGLVFVPFLILRFVPDFIFAVPLLAAVIPAAGVFLALLFPLGRTNDFRGDLRAASVLKTWPLPPERLVLGTLLAPWLASLILLAFTLIAGAALAAGLYFAP